LLEQQFNHQLGLGNRVDFRRNPDFRWGLWLEQLGRRSVLGRGRLVQQHRDFYFGRRIDLGRGKLRR
jgi:hypothetical protein